MAQKATKVFRLTSTCEKYGTLSSETKAYLAALIDSEGCVGIRPKHRGKSFYPEIHVGNVNFQFLDRARQLAKNAGKIGKRTLSWDGHKGTKPFYMWRVTGYTAFWLITQISEWLIVKKERAIQILAWGGNLGR